MDDGVSQTDEICLAVWQGNCKLIQSLSDHGYNLNGLDEDGLSPLYCAIEEYQVEAVKLLLELGADSNLRDETTNGFTPLDAAVLLKARNRAKERVAIVELLLRHGADPTIRTWMQVNALERAADRRNDDQTKSNIYSLIQRHVRNQL